MSIKRGVNTLLQDPLVFSSNMNFDMIRANAMCWSLSYATDDVTCIRIMELIGLGRSYQMTPSYKIGLTTSHSVVYIANNKHLRKGQHSA